MGRQGKNTRNTTNSNTKPVKNSDPTTARLDKPNIDEGEENNLKNNFRRMYEAFKKKMKKKWRKRQRKNLKTSKNPLEKTKKKQSNIRKKLFKT